MAAEPTDPTLGVSPSQGAWAPGGVPWSQLNNRTGNSTSRADGDQPSLRVHYIVSLLTVLVCLCGAAGNGAVVWLLGFRLKRTPFSVYILNLACADGAFLLGTGVWSTLRLLRDDTREIDAVMPAVQMSPFLAGLGLLMAVSTERCVSVLCPLWHRCHRPAHLSCAVCALIWGLALCGAVYVGVCGVVAGIICDGVDWVYLATVVTTFLVLCVSGLTLLLQVQCVSQGPRPGRLYVTILLTVLAFLLLALPIAVYFLVLTISSPTIEIPGLWDILDLLFTLNSVVNPVIYFFVGRYRQRPGRTPLREVLQRALRDEEEGAERRVTPIPPLTSRCPLIPIGDRFQNLQV